MSQLYLDTIVNEGNINARQEEREYALQRNESWVYTGKFDIFSGYLWKNQVTGEEIYEENNDYFSFDYSNNDIPNELYPITIEDVELEYDVVIGIQNYSSNNEKDIIYVIKKIVLVKELKKNQTVEINGLRKTVKLIRNVKNNNYRKLFFTNGTSIVKNSFDYILTISS